MRLLLSLAALLCGAAPLTARAEASIWMLAHSLHPGVNGALNGGVRGAPMLSAPLADPGAQCRAAIAAAEVTHAIPPHLLGAIGVVESGRPGPTGAADPWPWSINVEGTDHVYDTKAQAIAAVRAFQAQGARSIDVGCLQVNLMYHPDAFASLDDAFDPVRNATYAAQFLVQLHAQTGSWTTATAWYHSATPELGTPYAARVMARLPGEQLRPAPQAAAPVGSAFPGFAKLPDLPRLQGFATLTGLPGQAGALAAPQAGAFMLHATTPSGRLRLADAGGGAGRGLAAYRSAPVRIASVRLVSTLAVH